MPPASGTTLGSYQVTAKIGEGGMGEVYRAGDAKLDVSHPRATAILHRIMATLASIGTLGDRETLALRRTHGESA